MKIEIHPILVSLKPLLSPGIKITIYSAPHESQQIMTINITGMKKERQTMKKFYKVCRLLNYNGYLAIYYMMQNSYKFIYCLYNSLFISVP